MICHTWLEDIFSCHAGASTKLKFELVKYHQKINIVPKVIDPKDAIQTSIPLGHSLPPISLNKVYKC
jgi:hypothetical protein